MNLDIQIRVLGRLNPELYWRFNQILSFENNDTSEAILFCDYSEFNIPVGMTFRSIETEKGDLVFSGIFYLKAVTQQYAKEFDEIPMGWKTVSSFQFIMKEVPSIILNLPQISGWGESNQSLIFKS